MTSVESFVIIILTIKKGVNNMNEYQWLLARQCDKININKLMYLPTLEDYQKEKKEILT